MARQAARHTVRGLCLSGGVALALALLAACASASSAAINSPHPPPAIPIASTIPISSLAAQSATPTPLSHPATAIALPPAPMALATPTSSPTPTVWATPTPPPTPTPIPALARQQLFTEVWTTVNEKYLYPDFRGLDWQGIRAEFEPRIAAAGSDKEFYELLAEMVRRLNDHHSRFLAPSAAEQEDERSSGLAEQVGIGVIMAPADQSLIQIVFPGSPADLTGLRPRDRIIAVDGMPLAQGGHIEGPEGSQVRLTVVSPGDHARDVVLTRQRIEGRIGPAVRRLDGDVAYIGISTLWVNDMDGQVSGALTDLVLERPLRGLIMDLRGNPGGWRSVLEGILSHFVTGTVGTFFSQRADKPLEINQRSGPDLRDIPLVVLIDGGTASYAELLAGILQVEAGAVVIGTPSAGNTETIYAYELAGGSRLWVAQEGFRLLNGINLEDRGVQPDIEISQDWTRYSEDTDPGILEALRVLDGK